VLEANDVAIDSFVAATTIDSDDMRRGWVGAAAAGLDVATVTAQARLALNERGDDDKHEILHLVTALGPGPHPMTDASRLGIDEHEALVAALGATSDSKAHSAFEILWVHAVDSCGSGCWGCLRSADAWRHYWRAVPLTTRPRQRPS
jgi:hypothetical protein